MARVEVSTCVRACFSSKLGSNSIIARMRDATIFGLCNVIIPTFVFSLTLSVHVTHPVHNKDLAHSHLLLEQLSCDCY